MRIELLRLREDFDEGFIQSLSDFLSEKYQWKGQMVWHKGVANAVADNQCAFYTNDFLNIIYPSSIPRQELSPFTKEFAYNPNFLRRTLQRFYVSAAVRFPLEKFITSATLIIDDAPSDMLYWVFLPGNHSHRVIDLKKQQSLVFAKRGFNQGFLHADAATRQENQYLPSPEIIEFKAGQNWFVEEQVTGLPINRLSDVLDRDRAITQANQAMLQLYASTIKSVDVADYVEQLRFKVLQQNELMSSAITTLHKKELNDFLEALCFLALSPSSVASSKIPIALSHGDYQAANILLDDDRVWLIDWEYSDLRSLYFDSFCLVLNTRFSVGLASRVDELILDMQRGPLFELLPESVPVGRVDILWLFLLEEFLLKLTEVSTPKIQQKMTNILPWVHEIKSIQLFKECK